MARSSSVTDPTAEVTVATTVTQKVREDLKTLSLMKENISLKALVAKLIQNYLDENATILETLAEWRRGSIVPTDEVSVAH